MVQEGRFFLMVFKINVHLRYLSDDWKHVTLHQDLANGQDTIKGILLMEEL